jgi:hypothetical protein
VVSDPDIAGISQVSGYARLVRTETTKPERWHVLCSSLLPVRLGADTGCTGLCGQKRIGLRRGSGAMAFSQRVRSSEGTPQP